MKVAIMQPYFMPYLGYFQLISAVDKFIIYDDVNFIKRGWVNRNRILNQGRDLLISMPLLKASQNKKINEIEVFTDPHWRKKLLKSIDIAYRKAPFFDQGFDLTEKTIHCDEKNLSQFLYSSIVNISEYLGIKTKFVNSSSIYENDHLSGAERIVDICLKEGASMYINPVGGMQLYKPELFSKHGIQLRFLKTNPVNYEQLGGHFISNLSILDVIMFNDPNEIAKLLSDFELLVHDLK